VAALAFLAGAQAASATEIVDATGKSVRLPDQPRRIVTLIPSLGELAADLSGTELSRIVGVSEHTDYPPGLARVERIGPYNRVNIERVMALKPDLVLASVDGNIKDQVLHLRELGLPVVVVSTETIDQVPASIRLVAKSLGAPAAGEAMAERFRAGLERVRERGRTRAANGRRKRVALQLGEDPLIVIGSKSFLHGALDAVGAENIFAESSAHYPRPSIETVLQRDPDAIVVLALGDEPERFRKMAARWGHYPGLRAVKGKQVSVLQADPLLRPTLRLLEGLALLERTLFAEKTP
jgi:iron complex transport system substrate-binding protein